MVRDHHWRLARRAIAEVEGHTRGRPLGQDLFLNTTQMKDMLTLVELDTCLLTQSCDHANVTVVILTVVFVEFNIGSLVVLFDAVFVKTW